MRIRYLKTESHIYSDHLTSERPSTFDRFIQKGSKRSNASAATQTICYPTNCSLQVKNAYLFVLIHLRKTASSKNKLGISIPDICIFDKSVPYDVLYSHQGDIKGLRTQSSLRLKEAYSHFKQRSFEAHTNKKEVSMACFENEQFLILSDEDLFLVCRKHRTDSFFKKLQYLRNKLNLSSTVREVFYDESVDFQFTAAATECFAGYKSESEMLQTQGEDKYLKYCNEKIALFLNYEQNIRIKKALFCYSKGEDGIYYLTNVKQMEYHNLTGAIEQRQRRLRERESERNKILQMSHEKYERYKSEESKPLVQEIQAEMDNEFFKITNKLSLRSSLREVLEEKKTEAAFRRLYPQKHSINELISTTNFALVREEVLKSKERKKLGRPTKFMKKRDKLDARVRATYTHFPISDA